MHNAYLCLNHTRALPKKIENPIILVFVSPISHFEWILTTKVWQINRPQLETQKWQNRSALHWLKLRY